VSTPQQLDAGTERRIEESIERRGRRMPVRMLAVNLAGALAFLIAATTLAVTAHPARALNLPLAAAFVVAYILAGRATFVFGASSSAPTHLVFVPMLLLLPTPYVPLIVAMAMILGDLIRPRGGRDWLILAIADAWFSLAPAAVLIALSGQTPSWDQWWIYVLAFAAQFAVDSLGAGTRVYVAFGLGPKQLMAEMTQVYRTDALLSPIALLAAIAAAGQPATALLVLPLVYMLSAFAREREARIAQSIEMTRSFRGTAFLLRDLLEEDDEYTGHHTEDVVELSVKVADQLGVDEQTRRETELGALLHDIGKIHIPDAIINKPGKLDAEEWAIMKTHTILGQEMLDQVGGMLTDAGLVVRASHERYDGGGYPDGLRAGDIPLAARIVAACDSFNAMTTTRSYRKALPVAHAVDELERCSGTQFDPAVVDALLAVVGDPGWTLTIREPDTAPKLPAATPIR
jgi:putative nucleotidyltransferase with HDIG domain